METIKGENFIARYDAANHIIYGIFGTIATPEATAALYAAITELLLKIDVKTVRGLAMDFRRVERFDKGNMIAVKEASTELSNRFDLKNLPVALVVETHLQEQIVDFTTRVTPDPERKQIVYSIAESYNYFSEWHSGHNASV